MATPRIQIYIAGSLADRTKNIRVGEGESTSDRIYRMSDRYNFLINSNVIELTLIEKTLMHSILKGGSADLNTIRHLADLVDDFDYKQNLPALEIRGHLVRRLTNKLRNAYELELIATVESLNR
jgi:hypothetical protein